MAVTGGAEFELVPVLAAGFKKRAEDLVNRALGQVDLKTNKGGQLGTQLGIQFGGTLAKEVKAQVRTVRAFLISELAGIQNEINRKTAQAQVSLKLARDAARRVDRNEIPTLPSAGQTRLGGANQPMFRHPGQIERERQREITAAVQAGESERTAAVREAARVQAQQEKDAQAKRIAAAKAANAQLVANQREFAQKIRTAIKTPQLPALPAAGQTSLGGQSPQPMIQAAEFVEKKRQEVITKSVRAGEKDRQKLVRESQRTAETQAADAQKRANARARAAAKAPQPASSGLGRFFQNIQARTDAFAASLGQSSRVVAQLLGAGLTGSILVVGARLAAAAFRVLAQTVAQAVVEFGKLEDAVSASNLLFGTAAGRVLDFATSTDRVSLSATAALKASQEFATALQGIGFSDDALANASLSLTQIAEDLSSVTGIDVQTVIARLAQGAQGDVRSLRSLRINIRESAIEQEALRLGLKLTGIELTDAAKFAAFYSKVIEQTKFAQGDAANTSTSFNNSLAQLKKTWQNFLAAVGSGIAPTVAEFFRRLATVLQTLTTFMPVLVGMFKGLFASIHAMFPSLRILIDAWKTVTDFFKRASEATAGLRKNLDDLNLAQAKQAAKDENYNRLAETKFDVLSRVISADLAYKQAELGVQQATLAVTQAEIALTTARIEASRQNRYVLQAENALAQARLAQRRSTTADESASLDLRDARLALAEAERDYADVLDPSFVLERTIEAQLKYKQAALESTKAQRALSESNLELEQTTFDVFLATEKIVQMRRRGTSSAAEMVKAQLELSKATRQAEDERLDAELNPLRAQQAALEAIKAQRELSRIDTTIAAERERADINHQRSIISRIQAELGIEGAVLDQAAATQSAVAAEDAYNDALRTRENFHLTVTAAEQALTGAKLSAIGATQQLALAEIEFRDAMATANNEVFSQTEKFEVLMFRMREIANNWAPATVQAISAIPREIKEQVSPQLDHLNNAVDAAMKAIQEKGKEQLHEFLDYSAKEIKRWAKELLQSTATGALKLVGFAALRAAPGGVEIADFFQRRASGGPVAAYRSYIVGEKGPEIFTPTRNGTIIPNGAVATHITNHFSLPPTSPHILADLLTRRILRRAL